MIPQSKRSIIGSDVVGSREGGKTGTGYAVPGENGADDGYEDPPPTRRDRLKAWGPLLVPVVVFGGIAAFVFAGIADMARTSHAPDYSASSCSPSDPHKVLVEVEDRGDRQGDRRRAVQRRRRAQHPGVRRRRRAQRVGARHQHRDLPGLPEDQRRDRDHRAAEVRQPLAGLAARDPARRLQLGDACGSWPRSGSGARTTSSSSSTPTRSACRPGPRAPTATGPPRACWSPAATP